MNGVEQINNKMIPFSNTGDLVNTIDIIQQRYVTLDPEEMKALTASIKALLVLDKIQEIQSQADGEIDFADRVIDLLEKSYIGWQAGVDVKFEEYLRQIKDAKVINGE